MGFFWNPSALPGFLILALSLLMAALVVFAVPGRQTANVRLSIVLALEGIHVGFASGLSPSFSGQREAYVMIAIATTAVLLLPFAYLRFLAVLGIPLTRWLGSRAALAGLALAALAVQAWWFASPLRFVAGMEPFGRGWQPTMGQAMMGFDLAACTPVYLFAFIAALVSFQRAPTTLSKRRAAAFLLAFGVLDVGVIATKLLLVTPAQFLTPQVLLFSRYGFMATLLLFLPLLAYGILRTQLLDIQLKLKVGLKRGTLASLFLLIMMIVSEVVQTYSTQALGLVTGSITAGLVVLGMRPLQQMAEKLAGTTVPNAAPILQLPYDERLHLFQEQLEFAWSDGSISKKETMLLAFLRSKLGLTADAVAPLETQIAQRYGKPAGGVGATAA